jgi:membrane associated rhomboid family serine protease
MFFIPYGTIEEKRKKRFPYITAVLLLVNIAVFVFQASLLLESGEAGLASFIQEYAAVPANITDGTPFEIGLFTAMFLHGGLLHIIGNMIYLLPFGDNVEDSLGHFRYLLFYLLTGIAGTILYTVFNAGSTVPLIGASGAIAGVLGGYLALHPRGRVKGFFFIIILLIPLTLPAILFIGYWFIMQLFGSVASLDANAVGSAGGVAYMAHVGGFIAGLLLAPLMAQKQHPTSFETEQRL